MFQIKPENKKKRKIFQNILKIPEVYFCRDYLTGGMFFHFVKLFYYIAGII